VKIGIGIVTYNTPKSDIDRWVLSLSSAISRIPKDENIEILVLTIDNSFKKPTFNNANLFKLNRTPSSGNLGYTKGINILIEKAITEYKCDFFLSANPDGIFHPDFFVNIAPFSRRFKKSVIESIQFPEEHLKFYNRKTYETDWASGCCTLYPAD
jgi:GT2 family glycosyltransferase